MKIKSIKISENKYNGHFSVGSIFENSVSITMNQNLFEEDISKITKDSVLCAVFRRTFKDADLNFVSIEIPSPIIHNIDSLLTVISQIVDSKYEIVKDRKFNLRDYMNKITISINDDKTEYEVDKNSELGSKIMELSGLGEMLVKSNKEIIESIKL